MSRARFPFFRFNCLVVWHAHFAQYLPEISCQSRHLKGLVLQSPDRTCLAPALRILILTCQGKESGGF